MQLIANGVALTTGLVACMFVGPTIAIAFLLLRKQRARRGRRSPIVRQMLRGPGHSIAAQITESYDKIDEYGMSLFAGPVLLVALVLGFAQIGWPLPPWMLVFYVAFALIAIALVTWRLVRISSALDNLRAGFDAELAVGQELDQLARSGAYIFHDLPADGFNVDHVVVAAEGVFAVETKGTTKPKRAGGKADATVVYNGSALQFPQWTTDEPIKQASRQARWLERWLGKGEESIVVTPIVALPGWFVHRTARADVRVFNDKELRGLLKTKNSDRLTNATVSRLVARLDDRCRTVVPLYGPR